MPTLIIVVSDLMQWLAAVGIIVTASLQLIDTWLARQTGNWQAFRNILIAEEFIFEALLHRWPAFWATLQNRNDHVCRYFANFCWYAIALLYAQKLYTKFVS